MKKIISILIITFFITGCVKMNASMKINKNKSMDYELILAFDKSLIDQTNANFNEDSIKTAENNGFKVTEYNNDSMSGYKFIKHFNNIDSVSTTENIVGSLDVDSNEKYIFTVKKGFLKNTYKANLTSNSTDLNGLDPSSLNQTNDLNNNSTTDSLDINNIDYSSMSNMDVKFEVTLPYKAVSSNATYVNDKTLTWDLLTLKDKSIEFEFELYNYKNIIIVAVVLFIILILIVVILNKTGKHKNNNNDNDTFVPTQPESQINQFNSSTVQENVWEQPIAEQTNTEPQQNIWNQTNFEQPVQENIPQQPNQFNQSAVMQNNQENVWNQPMPNQVPEPPIQNNITNQGNINNQTQINNIQNNQSNNIQN